MATKVKAPKITKEDLLVELTKAKEKIEHLETRNESDRQSSRDLDENRRKEFAKAFNWNRVDMTPFGYANRTCDRPVPTWPEIFVEIGRLKSFRDYTKLQDNVDSLDRDIRELIQKEQERNNQEKGQGCVDRFVR